MKSRLIQMYRNFIICHEGTINRILHVLGIALVIFGLFDKDIVIFIAGAFIQEFGHVYQYFKPKQYKYSPLFCFKPQLLFAYPLFLIGALYILFSN